MRTARKTWQAICDAGVLSRWPLTEHEDAVAIAIIAQAVVEAQEVVLRARASADEPLGLLRLIVAEAQATQRDEYTAVPTTYIREAKLICGKPAL